jgi:hypothetical protein
MGINPDAVNIDACIQSYKAGARSMIKATTMEKTNTK